MTGLIGEHEKLWGALPELALDGLFVLLELAFELLV